MGNIGVYIYTHITSVFVLLLYTKLKSTQLYISSSRSTTLLYT